jgi:GH35 family endo-1,4-beta-xylanase
MAKKLHLIRFFSILALFPILLLGSAQASAKNSGSNYIYLPMVMNNYQSWSTNFANVTDLAASGIWGTQTQVAIDTTNVNSGGKSIKAYGTIGQVGACLNLAFGFWGVVGQDSVDLSEKTLNLEIYLPADSPIYSLFIHVFSGGKYVIVREAHDNMYKGQWHTYKVDIREDITLKTWRSYSNMTSPGLTDAQAVDILKNAQTIAIVGGAWKDHTPAESYLLVDRLGWESAGPAPAYDPSLESLQQYAPASLPIGGIIEPDGAYDPEYMQHFVQEFHATRSWGLFPVTEPAGDVFTYDQSWGMTPYAEYFNETKGFQIIRGDGLGENPNWIPDWLKGKSYAQTQAIMEDYIHAHVGHFNGKTDIWLLFGELLRDDISFPLTGFGLKDRNQTPQTHVKNYSPFSNSPSDISMLEDLYGVAKAADPDALLIDNEAWASAEGSPVGEALYNMVAKMKHDGTPIDGVGFEGHYGLDQYGNFFDGYGNIVPFDPVYGFTTIAANVERYAALGLKVAFTEVDIPIYLADIDTSTPAGQALLAQRRELQAAAYRSLLHIALTHPNVVYFDLWDWADEYSYWDQEWGYAPMPGYGNDLGLFDMSYQKKPSYYAMLDELKAVQLPLPGPFNKVSPADEATEQPTALTLSWGASPGATGYEVCLDTSTNNGCNTAWISTGTSTSVAISGLLPFSTYSWQVRAKNASGFTHANQGAWRTFSTTTDWSTNFADVADPAAAGISSPDNLVALDTTNVNSGGKSIKASGSIGHTGSKLDLNFSTQGLLGTGTFDLSQKTIRCEIYLPADSPVDTLDLYIYNNGQYVVIGSLPADAHKGAWYTYSVDISAVIALKSWITASPGLSDDQAVYILKNAQTIAILGAVSTEHTPAPSYFLVDRIGLGTSVAWTNQALHQPATASSSENPSLTPDRAVDGDLATRWSSAWSDPQWIQVDLGATYNLNCIVLQWDPSYATAYQIHVSSNATDWETLFSTSTGDGGIDYISVSGSGRYMRMVGTQRVDFSGNRYSYSLREFEVYGTHP